MDLHEVMRILESFEKEEVDYVLVGGAALNFHGIIRATEDIDLFIRPTFENVERLRNALRAVFNDPNIDDISADDLAGDYPAVRYFPPKGELYLDILARLGEFAAIDDLESEEMESLGVRFRIATPKTLYWLKKGTVRAIDHADAQALLEKFHLDEEVEKYTGGADYASSKVP